MAQVAQFSLIPLDISALVTHAISLDRVHSTVQVPSRIHLDLYTEDQAGEVERLIGLGATEVHWDKRPPDADCVILADPDDTVNVASRLETSAEPNRIHVSEDIANAVREKFRLEPRGAMELKGKGQTTTFYLMGLEGSLTARIQRR